MGRQKEVRPPPLQGFLRCLFLWVLVLGCPILNVQGSNHTGMSGHNCPINAPNLFKSMSEMEIYKLDLTTVNGNGSSWWTRWIDNDDPSGNGDYESLGHQIPDTVCEPNNVPAAVECRTVKGKIDASQTNDVTLCSMNDGAQGFSCVNANQPKVFCQDYEVRYLCDKGPRWYTEWIDNDNPSGYGDYEPLGGQETTDAICGQGGIPVDVECRTVSGKIEYSQTGQVSICSLKDGHMGFGCVNAAQTDGRRCMDYELRFLCMQGWYTTWTDSDDPRGSGDYEPSLASGPVALDTVCGPDGVPIDVQCRTVSGKRHYLRSGDVVECSLEHGLKCINSMQPNGTTCQDYEMRFICKHRMWTEWMNENHPSDIGEFEGDHNTANTVGFCEVLEN